MAGHIWSVGHSLKSPVLRQHTLVLFIMHQHLFNEVLLSCPMMPYGSKQLLVECDIDKSKFDSAKTSMKYSVGENSSLLLGSVL
jgi:hypothetical protein